MDDKPIPFRVTKRRYRKEGSFPTILNGTPHRLTLLWTGRGKPEGEKCGEPRFLIAGLVPYFPDMICRLVFIKIRPCPVLHDYIACAIEVVRGLTSTRGPSRQERYEVARFRMNALQADSKASEFRSV